MKRFSFSYFPGCSQRGSAEEFGLSTKAVCRALGIELEELPDWNCCGASSAHMTNDLLAVTLPGRDLALARQAGKDMLVVCVGCYSRMKVSQKRMLEDEACARKVESILGMNPRFTGKVRHLLDVMANDVGAQEIKPWLRADLSGLKAAPYYGCLLARPLEFGCCDSVENPRDLDRLLEAIGVEARPWSFKTDCCGASLSLTRSDIVSKMVNKLFIRAQEAGANCIVTACPMCMANLETRQQPAKFSFKVPHKMPVFYFTELLGLAMGLDSDDWFKSHVISPMRLLKELNLTA